MRKSSPSIAKNGNVRKADSYREAWARVKAATENEFFIEAAAIIESIISDRLQSYLVRQHDFPARMKTGWHYTLHKLIEKTIECASAIGDENGKCILQRIDEWRRQRNEVIHSLVQSDPGEPTISVESFLNKAKHCCVEGSELARLISEWCKRQSQCTAGKCLSAETGELVP